MSAQGEKHLVCVEVGGKTAMQSNKYYKMIPSSDGQTFIAKWGRVGGREDSKTYPMSDWNSTYREKTGRKGYKDITEFLIEDEVANVVVSTSKSSTNIPVKKEFQLITLLQSLAKGAIQKNYTVSSEKVTSKMVIKAQEIVDQLVPQLAKGASEKDLNKMLMDLYTVIPRKMEDVRRHLFKPFSLDTDILNNKNLLAAEQDTLDVMAGQVQLQESSKPNSSKTESDDIISRMNLTIIPIEENSEEFLHIKKMMGENSYQLLNLYRVENEITRKRFENYKSSLIKDRQIIVEKFHGSRNENWFNILQSGLLIKPAGAYHAGSMYGRDAIYHSSRFAKSLNYTSYKGSAFANGNQNKAFIAVHDVLLGKFLNTKDWNSSWYEMDFKTLSNKGYDSVWAEPGSNGLRNDEIMVYQINQTTVKYLIEIK